MKTLTEFDGFKLKNALEAQKRLTEAGKTAEELPAALGEELKLEGDKLTLLLNALEAVGSKTDNLKRVVVYAAEEGKKAPAGAKQKDDKHFLVEYFYTPSPKKPRREAKGRGPHGKGRRKRGRGGRNAGERGEKQGRGGRRPPHKPQAEAKPSNETKSEPAITTAPANTASTVTSSSSSGAS